MINVLGFLKWQFANRTNFFFCRNCFNASPAEVGVPTGGKAEPLFWVGPADDAVLLGVALSKKFVKK
jgi:hypothetical protein